MLQPDVAKTSENPRILGFKVLINVGTPKKLVSNRSQTDGQNYDSWNALSTNLHAVARKNIQYMT